MSAERGKPRRGGVQAASSRLLSDRFGVPIVVRVDQDAADRLGIDLETLEHLVVNHLEYGRLRIWGRHADGRPVFRLRELADLLEEEVLAGG